MEDMKNNARKWRSFMDARAFVHTLGLKSGAEWNSYCKSGEKPADIPSAPHQEYDGEFKGYGDWLATGTMSHWNREYRPFDEARAFVHALRLKNQDEWGILGASCVNSSLPACLCLIW